MSAPVPLMHPAEVLVATAAAFGISVKELTSKARGRRIARARHAAVYVLRTKGESYPSIGRVLDRDHSTIVASFRAAQVTASHNSEYARVLRDLVAGRVQATENRVRVLVCVGVRPDGSYVAYGVDGLSSDELRARVAGSDSSGVTFSWVEASLPLPQEPTFIGTLTTCPRLE